MASSTTRSTKSMYLGLLCTSVLLFLLYLKQSTSTTDVIPTIPIGQETESEPVTYIPPLNPEYNQDFTDLDEEESAALQRSRHILTRIKERCEAGNRTTGWNYTSFIQPRLLIAKREYNILYGSNPKTGSTSFKKFTFRLDGAEDGRDVHGNPDGHYEKVNKTFFSGPEDFKKFIKIGGIRNPLVRLISAFRNKQLREHWYIKEDTSQMSWREQFLKFIEILPSLNVDVGGDGHLMPQTSQMAFCQFPYDILIEVEESSGAIKLMQKLTGTTETLFPEDRVAIGKDTHSSMDLVYHFYSLLNQTELDIVYEIYKVDFDILPYTKLDEPGFPNIKLELREAV